MGQAVGSQQRGKGLRAPSRRGEAAGGRGGTLGSQQCNRCCAAAARPGGDLLGKEVTEKGWTKSFDGTGRGKMKRI